MGKEKPSVDSDEEKLISGGNSSAQCTVEDSDDTLLIKPDLVEEEERLREENEKLYQDEDAKIKTVEEDDLTPHQRYSKLCELLSKSKFYSNFLLEKMEKEDEESKNLKNKNLAGRKTRKEATIDQVTKKYPKRGRSKR